MLTPPLRFLVPAFAVSCVIAVFQWVAPASSDAQQPGAQTTTQQSYVGSNQCFTCHRRQVDAWDQSKHVRAFADLPDTYRGNPACLMCHVTAFDKPGGFVAGAEKDLLHVGCESCHGPGGLHINAAQRFILALPGEEAQAEKDLRESIVKTPGDAICAECHITQAHHKHPSYEGQPPAAASRASFAPFNSMQVGPAAAPTAAHAAAPGYSIKTCGACHYDEYKQWQSESHANLSALLSARRGKEPGCQSCHAPAGKASERIAGAISAAHGWIDAACESCHGPGLGHVRFNRPLIGRLSLTPESEQASRVSIQETKPLATCTQCHLGERHQSHPEYSKD